MRLREENLYRNQGTFCTKSVVNVLKPLEIKSIKIKDN
ncbi:unnamed protein product [Tenebrio molitor]|nr:unnamed protein product [Tenebrio molitor]